MNLGSFRMAAIARPSWLPRRFSLPLAATAALCLLLAPLLPLIHEATVLAIGLSLRAAASWRLFRHSLIGLGFDPVYASVFNRTLGNIEARGLAVAAPLGGGLHRLAPGLFASSDQVMPGAWATALVGDGASLLASAIAMVGTDVIFIAVGLTLLGRGLRGGRAARKVPFLALALLGLMLQARGLVGLVSLRFSFQDLEIMGLSHFFTKLLPVDAASYRDLVAVFQGFAAYLIPSSLAFAIYGAFLAVGLVRGWLPGRGGGGPGGLGLGLQGYLRLASQRLGHTALVAMALLAGAVLSQGFFPALANYSYPVEAEGASAPFLEEPVSLSSSPVQTQKAGPSRVAISGADYNYSYTVNGRPERIRGVGYNVMYLHLSPAERAARYDRDFALMKAAGINTILGWEKEQFDELTLEKAQEYGLGVVMPYYLRGNSDHSDPSYQQEVERGVKEWVKRFQKYPALRMWGIGNEVIHSMGRNPDTPRARAFAQFYVKLADAVQAIDPDHPVVYRDAEDLYLGPMKEALQRDGIRRPWFVYGVNFFTFRICEALPDWAKKGLDTPLMVSEFAPSGLSPEDRPKGYLRMWRCIAKQYPSVLGGFAYAWTTSGPEAIDRVLGLVDGEGQPVDRSLWALGRAFRRDTDGAPGSLLGPK